jgi:hypothetical protein
MKTWRTGFAIIALAFAAACGGAEPAWTPPVLEPQAAPGKAAGQAGGQAESPKTPEARADEIIADLKKREDEQTKIHEQVTGRVPVVVEVSPGQPAAQNRNRNFSGPGVAYPGSSAAAGVNNSEANYWRQEYTIAAARLETSQRRLEEARRKVSEAQQQGQSPNAALRKMGQDALNRAQQEYSQAQSAYYEDQSAVSRARSAAMQAGVPASALR